jgi:hypothetical protein
MEEKVGKIKEIVKKMGYDVIETAVVSGRMCFRLPDDLTRREVEDVAAFVSKNGFPCSPFGVPWRRGFNVRLIYLV